MEETKITTSIRVWTKQHKSVLDTLQQTGRYTAKREFIKMDMGEHAGIVLEAYEWLAKNGPDAHTRPADVEFPVWVSFSQERTMLLSEGAVLLELEIDPVLITSINIAKWGCILNYSYIPANEADAARHQKLLADYRISDAKAYMSQFYPEIKREIVNSWNRLFDDSVKVGNDTRYGNVWELRREWIRNIVQ